ncbi:COMM domain-containing protein 9 isoform X2 [Canis lupus dingo]|uniref:COMM domain-containing protein 9 isoform X2 n=1 Tax=Canis lupus dingo TaxID=286419 RepID=UPI000BAA00A4|nr:COMM domain-containing protein 9 isoform X2 [Canis lupus dingo]|eukprot:XP_022261029.1 COMM domain-containing protein 9 isoform X2 [Canis lupus familiaris]
MAALTAEGFAALQSLLKASSKDVVRQLCQESFPSSALGSEKLLDMTCSSLSVTQEEAEQLLQALHRLTRLVVFRDLSSAEAILALFPENFHQNLKNLLTKIILEHVSTWRTEAQANQSLDVPGEAPTRAHHEPVLRVGGLEPREGLALWLRSMTQPSPA